MLTFILVVTGILLAPGPMTMFIMSYSARFGLINSLWPVLGASLSYILLITLTAIGIGALLQEAIFLFYIIKWLGVLYLLYLAWKQWNTALNIDQISCPEKREPISTLMTRGFVVGVTNPKAILLFISVFPQFMNPAASNILIEYAILGAIFIPIQIITTLTYAYFGHSIMSWLKNDFWRSMQPKISAGLLTIAALWLALGTDKKPA